MPAQDTSLTKEKIISMLKINGPNLPVYIAREINLSPLFTSAFLSELFAEKRIKMSYMKVGSSPIYFIPGHEPKLEKFSQHLKSKEREAFNVIKEKKFLKDKEQQPAIRVALRSIRDFATPFKEDDEIYWRFFTIPLTEFKSQKIQEPPKIVPEEQEKHEPEEPKKKGLDIFDKEEKENFAEKIKNFLINNKIKLLDELESKKREYLGIGRIESHIGEIEILIIGKDKKKIVKKDFEKILERIDQNKRIALLICSGEIDKKTNEYYRKIKNIVKFIKI